jgi:hypothetical protein
MADMPTPRASCEMCRFWKRSEIVGGTPAAAIWGDCRRHAPRGAVVINEAASGCISGEVWPFPSTDAADWCGEFSSLDGTGGWLMPTQPEPVEEECPF